PVHDSYSALLFRHADPVSPVQRSRIQRPKQSTGARREDGGAAHTLHHGELRSRQEAVDGTAAHSRAAHRYRAAAEERVKLLTLERDHFQLHLDTRLLLPRFRDCLLDVCSRWFSAVATAQ